MSVQVNRKRSRRATAGDYAMASLGFIGHQFLRRVYTIASLLALLIATIRLAARPRVWTLPVRSIFARQILFTAIDAVPVALRFGGAVGILIIVQVAMWNDALGISTEEIAPLLWRAIVREIAPLIACLVVIGRSCIAISTELATMVVGGEIEVLDSQGLDPMTCLVMPRILSVTLSTFLLAILLATTMVVTGYVIGTFVGAIRIPWSSFVEGIVRESNWVDFVFFCSKTLIAGGFAGAICCMDGLSVRASMTDVPRVTSRSGIRALTAVFAISAVLSVLIYGRFLIFKIGG